MSSADLKRFPAVWNLFIASLTFGGISTSGRGASFCSMLRIRVSRLPMCSVKAYKKELLNLHVIVQFMLYNYWMRLFMSLFDYPTNETYFKKVWIFRNRMRVVLDASHQEVLSPVEPRQQKHARGDFFQDFSVRFFIQVIEHVFFRNRLHWHLDGTWEGCCVHSLVIILAVVINRRLCRPYLDWPGPFHTGPPDLKMLKRSL